MRLPVRGPFPITDAQDILQTLYPALIEFAQAKLRNRRQPEHHAEDLVQAAVLRWYQLVTESERAEAYMRKVISDRAIDLGRERSDAMSHSPISLDTLEA